MRLWQQQQRQAGGPSRCECHGTRTSVGEFTFSCHLQLTRGQFFLTRAVLVPPRTRIVGAGMGLTGLYFREDTEESAPQAYITINTNVTASPLYSPAGVRDPSPTAWGLSDLTIFVSAYHNAVIDVPNITDGFIMRASTCSPFNMIA